MEIRNIHIQHTGASVRLEADVARRGKPAQRIYFAVPEGAGQIRADGSAFVAALLLPCMTTGEDLTVHGAVSPAVLEACARVQELVLTWPLHYQRIRVSATGRLPDSGAGQGRGLFFSGGVDSFYTYFHERQAGTPVTHLILVHGFDIPPREAALYQDVQRTMRRVAARERVTLLESETNLREVTDAMLGWDYEHGAAMAAVGYLFRGTLSAVLYSGGMEEAAIRPYGMHPELDPRWSVPGLSMVHIGTQARRIDKLQAIAGYPLVRESLRVCFKNSGGAYNCGRCEKCLRTMLSLEALGQLRLVKTLPPVINPAAFDHLYLYKNQIRYFREGLDILERDGKQPELRAAVSACIARNTVRPGWHELLQRVKHELVQWDARTTGGRLYARAKYANLV